MNLVRNHRTLGYEVTRASAPDGRDLVILQTSPTAQTVAPAHTLLPVSADEAAFEARMAVAAAIERARFLGLDAEQITALFTDELSRSD